MGTRGIRIVRKCEYFERRNSMSWKVHEKQRPLNYKYRDYTNKLCVIVTQSKSSAKYYKKGFLLTKKSIEALGNPDYVEIMYDLSSRLVAIVPSKKGEAGAYRFGTDDPNEMTKRIDARSFFVNILDLDTGVYSAQLHSENMLVIDAKVAPEKIY